MLPSASRPSPSPPPTGTVVLGLTASGSVSDYSDTLSLQQTIAAIAAVDTSAVTISVTAASVRITVNIAVPTSTTAAALQSLLSTSLSSAAAASEQLGITVEEVPTVQLALSLDDVALLPNTPDAHGGEDATMLALIGSGLVVAAVLAASIFARKRHLDKKGLVHIGKIDPTLVSLEIGSLDSGPASEQDSQGNVAHPAPAPAHTVAYNIPHKGMLLDGTAQMRTGLEWYRTVGVQLLAAPVHTGESNAPAWSALVIDGVTVPYDEVLSVRTVESALSLIVEQVSHGEEDPAPKHLRMHSHFDFNLWREALQPKVLNQDVGLEIKIIANTTPESSNASQINAARNWLASQEASMNSLSVPL